MCIRDSDCSSRISFFFLCLSSVASSLKGKPYCLNLKPHLIDFRDGENVEHQRRGRGAGGGCFHNS